MSLQSPKASAEASYHLIEMHLGITESVSLLGCGHNRSKPGASHHPSLNLQPMCGRYALSRTELLEEFFEFSFTGNQILPRFNVAPTTQVPVIRLRDDGHRELIDLRWGLVPSWSRPGDQLPLLINARAETLSSKPAFSDAFQRRRCIVPASGYYEWQKLPGGAKQPFYITRRDGLPIAFAFFGRTQRNCTEPLPS